MDIVVLESVRIFDKSHMLLNLHKDLVLLVKVLSHLRLFGCNKVRIGNLQLVLAFLRLSRFFAVILGFSQLKP